MKSIAILSLFFASSVFSQTTGSFAIQSDNFAEIFNQYRIGKPANTPWAGSYWSFRNDGIAVSDIQGQAGISPAKKYDAFFNQSSGNGADNASTWEAREHSCDRFANDKKTQDSCNGWWGHCNAWSAAAIKEPEPRESFKAKKVDGKTESFSVADQKAYLTEMWMTSGTLFAGLTEKFTPTGKWVFDPNSAEALKKDNYGVTAYDAFWDVTPRAFFLIFTNYIGIQKMGVVIDRFTGDQVWNQPVVGYKILPINADNILPPKKDPTSGANVYPVLVQMKIYWAEDGVYEHEVSLPFDIMKESDLPMTPPLEDEKVNKHYSRRLLSFFLYFDAPVIVSADGLKIEKAGKIVGEGTWYHQTKAGRSMYSYMEMAHPDFIWLPTIVYANSSGSGNPYISQANVTALFDQKTNTPIPQAPATLSVKRVIIVNSVETSFPEIKFVKDQLEARQYFMMKQFKNIFEDLSIKQKIARSKISFNGNTAEIPVEFLQAINEATLLSSFKNYGLTDITLK